MKESRHEQLDYSNDLMQNSKMIDDNRSLAVISGTQDERYHKGRNIDEGTVYSWKLFMEVGSHAR